MRALRRARRARQRERVRRLPVCACERCRKALALGRPLHHRDVPFRVRREAMRPRELDEPIAA